MIQIFLVTHMYQHTYRTKNVNKDLIIIQPLYIFVLIIAVVDLSGKNRLRLFSANMFTVNGKSTNM